jgi:hypothetical protein
MEVASLWETWRRHGVTYQKTWVFIWLRLVYNVNYVWNVMAYTQKPDFVFRRNGRVHLNRRGRQFSRLLAAELCASAVVMLDTPCPEVVWKVLATHSIRQLSLHFPSCTSPCAITFQLDSTTFQTRNCSTFVVIIFTVTAWLTCGRNTSWINKP